ncbi:Alpha-amylase [Caballeronia glathei]|uniref:Alpha-1,4-glucan:maltose-1-phosphate maltosyltransferase n=1 Tax=Caballeronia glathei TaxID=60547 RepID=A0A069PKR7_9BURK|nr:maltotransferase domain-containing protein [Caballeronia glathei]KDR41180.1 alpha-amylase [Caballeronia glathei]CDY74411.1 Alpha-amylase [Caballeronia glathei]
MENHPAHHAYAPRIYYIDPLLVGPLSRWPAQFEHAAALGFDHVLIGSPFVPGANGHRQAVADHHRLHPVFGHEGSASDGLRQLADAAKKHGLALLVDMVIDRVSADGGLYHENRHWFQPFESADARLDPRHAPREENVAHANFGDGEAAQHLTEWWSRELLLLADAGIGGFRFDAPHKVPAHVWRRLGAAVRERHPQTRWLAWTIGISRHDLHGLGDAGFDAVFSSSRWWDFKSSWLFDEHAALVRIAPPIAFPEEPFGTRLIGDLPDTSDTALVERAYVRALDTAAALGTGMLVPMGFEYGVGLPMSYQYGVAAEYERAREQARFNLSAQVKRANALQRDTGALSSAGELRPLTGAGTPYAALMRANGTVLSHAGAAVLVAVNPDLATPVHVDALHLLDGVPGNFTRFRPIDDPSATPAPLAPFTLRAGEVRLLRGAAEPFVLLAQPQVKRGSKAADKKAVSEAVTAPRVAIESVTPSVDHGRFPAKRIVGEATEIRAAIFAEGHDKIAAAVQWRAADETDWHEAPMVAVQPAGNDLWSTRIPLERVGRHEFTVMAWRDDYASLVDHMQKKLKAGQTAELEIEEARHLFALMLAEVQTAEGAAKEPLEGIVKEFTKADNGRKLEIVLAPETAQAVAAARHRPFLSRDPVTYRIDAERAAARFASWYEIFPRSMSDDENRHGTFIDVIGKMPRIREMGFDVLYFPPIHPIGVANRKGKNNTLTAGPGDVGSPYAIGGKEGGHTAVHPELGSLEDFGQMLEAAQAHGLEIALDFAVQCSPDHPWLKEHPTWFAWRPDGTLRYAENPPKKYQDIVNPDFYAQDAKPDLWVSLRDVFLFWVAAGVKIFRVDNPHTKPFPFWEWAINDVRARHPDVIFLSEAFTRPRVMNRLAKLGFSQSYTYFTWRESKRDFIEYMHDLTQTDAKDYFRPNFFVNTPDINPRFLQSSGRAGFMIRAALAATLSGLWGVYSGFELCEAAALPNSEEYLDSEKYQLRAWDWNRPGNIVGEVTALNRIRRANPALQTHLGVNFLPAHNEHILFFEKSNAAGDNVVLVAINLDPFNEQGADIDLPWQTLERWGVHEWDAVAVEDQVTGERFEWRGRRQHVRLDPNSLPFAIWRIAPVWGLPKASG